NESWGLVALKTPQWQARLHPNGITGARNTVPSTSSVILFLTTKRFSMTIWATVFSS
ncbi:hypothetical protein NDU88_008110, partial [Pleurodeles waltl]